MDSRKIILNLLFLSLLQLNIINSQTLRMNCIKKDSINIKCYFGDKNFYILGNRLFPDPCLNDEESFKIAEKTGTFLILEYFDTLFFLSKKEIFDLEENIYLPLINDSLINSFYKNYYKIIKDPDPPYWTALENKKDTIIVELKSQGYNKDCFLFGTIMDTIFQFSDGIKVGIDKNDFFKILGINLLYDKSNFTVILTSIFQSNVSWYFKYYCAKYTNDTYCYPDGFHIIDNFKYFFTFKDNKLVKIEFYS